MYSNRENSRKNGGSAVPVRMCSGCMERKEKIRLLRIVRQNGTVSVDISQKAQGRGAYVCPDVHCIDMAEKKKRFSSKLKCAIPPEVYEQLRQISDRK